MVDLSVLELMWRTILAENKCNIRLGGQLCVWDKLWFVSCRNEYGLSIATCFCSIRIPGTWTSVGTQLTTDNTQDDKKEIIGGRLNITDAQVTTWTRSSCLPQNHESDASPAECFMDNFLEGMHHAAYSSSNLGEKLGRCNGFNSKVQPWRMD